MDAAVLGRDNKDVQNSLELRGFLQSEWYPRAGESAAKGGRLIYLR